MGRERRKTTDKLTPAGMQPAGHGVLERAGRDVWLGRAGDLYTAG